MKFLLFYSILSITGISIGSTSKNKSFKYESALPYISTLFQYLMPEESSSEEHLMPPPPLTAPPLPTSQRYGPEYNAPLYPPDMHQYSNPYQPPPPRHSPTGYYPPAPPYDDHRRPPYFPSPPPFYPPPQYDPAIYAHPLPYYFPPPYPNPYIYPPPVHPQVGHPIMYPPTPGLPPLYPYPPWIYPPTVPTPPPPPPPAPSPPPPLITYPFCPYSHLHAPLVLPKTYPLCPYAQAEPAYLPTPLCPFAQYEAPPPSASPLPYHYTHHHGPIETRIGQPCPYESQSFPPALHYTPPPCPHSPTIPIDTVPTHLHQPAYVKPTPASFPTISVSNTYSGCPYDHLHETPRAQSPPPSPKKNNPPHPPWLHGAPLRKPPVSAPAYVTQSSLPNPQLPAFSEGAAAAVNSALHALSQFPNPSHAPVDYELLNEIAPQPSHFGSTYVNPMGPSFRREDTGEEAHNGPSVSAGLDMGEINDEEALHINK